MANTIWGPEANSNETGCTWLELSLGFQTQIGSLIGTAKSNARDSARLFAAAFKRLLREAVCVHNGTQVKFQDAFPNSSYVGSTFPITGYALPGILRRPVWEKEVAVDVARHVWNAFNLNQRRDTIGTLYFPLINKAHKQDWKIDPVNEIEAKIMAENFKEKLTTPTSTARVKRTRTGPCALGGCTTTSTLTNGREDWHAIPKGIDGFSCGDLVCGKHYRQLLAAKRRKTKKDGDSQDAPT